MPDIPTTPDIDLTTSPGATKTAVETILQGRYNSAIDWAQYGASLAESKLAAIIDAGEAFDVSDFMAAATAAINAIPELVVGAAPSTAMIFTNETFSDALIDTLRTKVGTTGTGLGDAEATLFARETARQNAARALAYTEVTTQFSARGFDMPPGALLAKQTELNNESAIRLSDSSSQIMAESARLAQSWNAATLSSGVQLLDLLARTFDSRVMRDFEEAKLAVSFALESFKAEVAALAAVGDLGSRKAIGIADIASKFGLANIETATRQYLGEINVLQSAANAAIQLVAGALNGVSASVSEGWSGRPQDPLATEGTTEYTYDADGNMLTRVHNPDVV